MAKKGKKSVVEEHEPMLGDDVRQSVMAIGLAAIGAVIGLAFFSLAISTEQWIRNACVRFIFNPHLKFELPENGLKSTV
jgi:hypothetical protein